MISDTTLLHLSLIDGIGPGAIKNLLASMPADVPLAALYEQSGNFFTHELGLSSVLAQKIVTGLRDFSVLEREVKLIEKHTIKILTVDDPAYPALLAAIHLPPSVLYIRGTLPENPLVAMVGARKANFYGQRAVNALVPSLIEHGFGIASGGALGADSMAHNVTLEAGGATVAVLGSGVLNPGPPSNFRMFEKILASGGALISSFPASSQALPSNFPARNRIIAGLSRGCIVIQAAAKSGARITAEFALQQGREVFAVPGHFDDALSAGCHALIAQGASVACNAEDIIQELDSDYARARVVQKMPKPKAKQTSIFKPATQPKPVPTFDDSTPTGRLLRACSQPRSTDELSVELKLSLADLNAQLFDLQIEGVLTQDFSGKWLRG